MSQTDPKNTTLVGQSVGNYKVANLIGKGGMGEVYLARHPVLAREVAIKVLSPACSHDSELVERFQQEAQAVGRIGHDAIVEITDFGALSNGRSYYVMELLRGESLRDAVERRGSIPLGESSVILAPVMRALQAAHDVGIIHRDIKPDNIFLHHKKDGTLEPKLLDFGIAKLTDKGDGSGVATRTGALMGTPTYMSPEQASGHSRKIGFHSDVYSMGAVLFHMLSGRPPFTGESFGELLVHHMQTPPPSITATCSGLPPATDALIQRAMAKEPADRHGSIREMLDELQAITKAYEGTLPPGVATPDPNAAADLGHMSTAAGMPVATAPPAAASPAGGEALATGPNCDSLTSQHTPDPPPPTAVPATAPPGSPPSQPPAPEGSTKTPDGATPPPGLVATESSLSETGPSVAPEDGWKSLSAVQTGSGGKSSSGGRGGLVLGLVLGTLVLLGGGGTGAYFLFFRDSDGGEKEKEEKKGQRAQTRGKAREGGETRQRPTPRAGREGDGKQSKTLKSRAPSKTPKEQALAANPWVAIAKPEKPLKMGLAKGPDHEFFFRHEAKVTCCKTGFHIQKHEVTWGEYELWAGGKKERSFPPPWHLPKTKARRKDLPVAGIPWNLASAYCKWLGGRLPTEGQWELAARDHELQNSPWGDGSARKKDVSLLSGRTAALRPVCRAKDDRVQHGQAELCDMGANAPEWTRDPFTHPYFPKKPPKGFPYTGKNKKSWRTVRGLAPVDDKKPVTSAAGAHRLPCCVKKELCKSAPQQKLFDYVGFRCVKPQLTP